MITVGVDLAAEPAGTGVAVLEWGRGVAHVVDLTFGVADAPPTTTSSRLFIEPSLR